MSKRLRLEAEYAKQLQQEATQEDDKLKKIQERIFAPTTWTRLTTGFRIVDLSEKHFQEVLDLITSDYINNEILCRNSQISEDPESLKAFFDHIMYTLKDSTSIMAVDENDNTIVGVLLLRVVYKENFGRVFSRVGFTDGEARKKCLEITSALNKKIDVYALYNCDVFLRYYLICVKESYRRKQIGYHLMRIGINVARSLHIPIVSGIFTSFNLQKYAKRLGFENLQEISYTNWRDKENELIFSDPGAGNYTCALMVARVPEEKKPDSCDIKILSPDDLRVVEPPRTRAEKRDKLNWKPAK